MPTRRTLLALAVAVAASACTSPPVFASGALVDLQIVERGSGDVLPTWGWRGARYVAGRPGERYAVRLKNRSGDRVLVVLSIDGVNAVSGETASTGQTGYVLGPWATAEITGWRKSYAEAAAFYFTALPDSYAARTDRPDNVGVIGAAVFRERHVAPPPRPYPSSPPPIARAEAPQESRRSAQGAAADAASDGEAAAASPSPSVRESRQDGRDRDALAKAEKLGTGHGEREYSPVRQTAFERASSEPAEVVQLRYDSRDNLLAAGVIPRRRPDPYAPSHPQAFPGFVADPG